MGPKGFSVRGGKRGSASRDGQSSGSQELPEPFAHAAYLAAQLAVQPTQVGQPDLPALGESLGRPASGHSLLRTSTVTAAAQPSAAPVVYYVHPLPGTMPNIVPPRVPALMSVASLPQQPSYLPILPPVTPAQALPNVGMIMPATPLTSAPAAVLQIAQVQVQHQRVSNPVTIPAANRQSSARSLSPIVAQPARTAQAVSSAGAVPLGRTASAHCLRHRSAVTATEQRSAAPFV